MDFKIDIPEDLKIERADSKKILELKAKLDALELVSSLINNFRESYTRQLVISGIEDENSLENKVKNFKIAEVEEIPNKKNVLEL